MGITVNFIIQKLRENILHILRALMGSLTYKLKASIQPEFSDIKERLIIALLLKTQLT